MKKFVFLDSAASAPRNGTQADGLCAQREFFPLLLRSGLSGVKLRWAHRLESLCSSAHGAAERKSNEKSAAAEHIQWHKTKSHPMIA